MHIPSALLKLYFVGPTGQPYYHNKQTNESTYIRPLPAFPVLPQGIASPLTANIKKKEKPLVKMPIPGTEWLRVTTTEGNVFYTHKGKKHSVWTVPDEIKDAVESLEKQEAEVKQKEDTLKRGKTAMGDEELKEVERIKSELRGVEGKRKADAILAIDEVVISKKARTEEEDGQSDQDGEDEDGSEDDESEEEWQREAAAQLAAEAEEEKKRQEEESRQQEQEAKKVKELETQKGKSQLNMPARVDLSIEEAKALFKVSLHYQ